MAREAGRPDPVSPARWRALMSGEAARVAGLAIPGWLEVFARALQRSARDGAAGSARRRGRRGAGREPAAGEAVIRRFGAPPSESDFLRYHVADTSVPK